MAATRKDDAEHESRDSFFRQSIDDAFEKSRMRTANGYVKYADFLDQLAMDDELPILIFFSKRFGVSVKVRVKQPGIQKNRPRFFEKATLRKHLSTDRTKGL